MNDLLELTRFRSALPDDPIARDRARDQLLSRIQDRQLQDRGVLDREPRHRRDRPWLVGRPGPTRRLVLAATAAAAGLAAVVVADSVVVRDEPPVGASAEAATLLNQAADRAIGSVDPVVGEDEYLRVTTVAVNRGSFVGQTGVEASWQFTYTEELFVPGDQAKEWVLRRGPEVPYRPEDAAIAEEVGGADPPRRGFTERALNGAFFGSPPLGNWGSPTPEFFASLPRDPEELLDQIRTFAADAGPSPDGEALVIIADTLRTGFVPADLRAALFQAAALIPGVELVDEQANLNGQVGVAVGRYEPNSGDRQEIIFDPETGMVIGEREVLVDRGVGPLLPPGSVSSWTAVTTDVVPATMVDQIPADPVE
ncbi:MAG TPA: CU044_5270 family protein [Natronosporangium sp.]